MKVSTSHRGRVPARTRPTDPAPSPYLMEDVAMTPSDLERRRTDDITSVVRH